MQAQQVEAVLRLLRAQAEHPLLASMEASALEILGRTEPAGALCDERLISLVEIEPPAGFTSVPDFLDALDDAQGAQRAFQRLVLGLDLPPRRVIRPEPGKLALFPSYMWHGTVPFEDEQPRVTIAFDMTPLDAGR